MAEKYHLVKETHVEGEEAVDPEQLTADLKAALQDLQEWEAGKRTLRITEYVDGERLEPAVLTRQELEQRQAERSKKQHFSYDPGSDALSIRLQDTLVETRNEIEPGIVVDYDQVGRVIGVEVMDASKRIKKAVGE